MSRACAACGAAAHRPYLTVARADDAKLVPTTDAYGSAPDDLVECTDCGHIQVASLPDPAALEAGYRGAEDESYVAEESGRRASARRALDRIERHVAPGALLDLGCWVGYLLSEAQARGWRATGVEPSQFASAFARNRLGLDVRMEAIEDADLPAAHYDAVVMADVIEHLPDPGSAVGRVRAALRPQGVLYLQLPDAGSTLARRLGARWWSVLPTHLQYFTRASVARLLDRHGLVVEWIATAPKTFTARYYAGRLSGYSEPLARALVRAAGAGRLADRLVTPDFRDRMEVVARVRD